MFKNLYGVFASRAARNTLTVFLSNFLSLGLGFVATVILVRDLGPDRFGMFAAALAVLTLTAQISDMGLNTTFVRFASSYFAADVPTALVLVRLAFRFKCAVAAVVGFAGVLLAHPLARYVLGRPELTPLIRVAFIGVVASILYRYLLTTLQARRRFRTYAAVLAVGPTFQLVAVVALLLTSRLDTSSAFLTYAAAPFFGFLVATLFSPKPFGSGGADDQTRRQLAGKLFHFGKWVAISTTVTPLALRLNILMLPALSTAAQAGSYAAAERLAMLLPLITYSLTTALLPEVASFRSYGQLRSYAKKVLRIAPLPILLLIVLCAVAGPLITFLFGAKYASSIGIFRILVISYSFDIVVNPASLVLYRLNMVKIAACSNVFFLVAGFFGNLVVIPRYGALGAASLFLVLKIVAVCWIGSWVYVLLRKARGQVEID